jgi:hypothetical protein
MAAKRRLMVEGLKPRSCPGRKLCPTSGYVVLPVPWQSLDPGIVAAGMERRLDDRAARDFAALASRPLPVRLEAQVEG